MKGKEKKQMKHLIRLTDDKRIIPGKHATGNSNKAIALVRQAFHLTFDLDDGSHFPKINGNIWIVKCYTHKLGVIIDKLNRRNAILSGKQRWPDWWVKETEKGFVDGVIFVRLFNDGRIGAYWLSSDRVLAAMELARKTRNLRISWADINNLAEDKRTIAIQI
jgi:hypothetical protein